MNRPRSPRRCAWLGAPTPARLSFARAYPDGGKTGTFTGWRGLPHEGLHLKGCG
jgi:hypothetical protein